MLYQCPSTCYVKNNLIFRLISSLTLSRFYCNQKGSLTQLITLKIFTLLFIGFLDAPQLILGHCHGVGLSNSTLIFAFGPKGFAPEILRSLRNVLHLMLYASYAVLNDDPNLLRMEHEK